VQRGGKSPEDRRTQENPYENLGGNRRLLPPAKDLAQSARQAQQQKELHQEKKDILLVDIVHFEPRFIHDPYSWRSTQHPIHTLSRCGVCGDTMDCGFDSQHEPGIKSIGSA